MESPSTTKGKVVLVPFPFDDFSATKVRPAVCLTNQIGEFEHIVIAFISSQLPENPEETDLVINQQTEGFATTGLAVASVIKLHRLITIPRNLIKRQLGSLPNHLSLEVDGKLKILFGLT